MDSAEADLTTRTGQGGGWTGLPCAPRTAEGPWHTGLSHSREPALEPQPGGAATQEAQVPWNTPTGGSLTGSGLAVHSRTGSVSLCPPWLPPNARGKAGAPALGRPGVASRGCGHQRDGSKTHPRSTKEHCVWSPCFPTSAKFNDICQDPQVRVPHHVLTWDGHRVCTRKTSKGQDSLWRTGDKREEGRSFHGHIAEARNH